MLEGKHFQNAYITRDIDKAVELFRNRFGVSDVVSLELPLEVTTPKGKGLAVNKIALIWINNLQYELIQPVSGLVDVYSDALPDDDSLKFHHICMRIDDWDSFRSNVEKQGYPVVLEGGTDMMKFVYLDARDSLGHYLEYVWATPEMWGYMGMR